MNRGEYLEELAESTPTDFCIGVAAYPEKHEEAPNLERDIGVLLEKQRAGAEYAVTQLFYDNEVFFRFVKSCQDQGVTSRSFRDSRSSRARTHVTSIPRTFNVAVPEALVAEVASVGDEKVAEVGSAGLSNRRSSCSSRACRRRTSTSCRTQGRWFR